MAKIVANIKLDMSKLDFGDLLDGNHLSYTKSRILVDGDNGHRDVFKGSFSVNAFSKTLSGTATSWTHLNRNTDFVHFAITGIKLSASSVLKAAKTSSLSDDRSIIRSMLSKSDTILGSSYADLLLGFDGNDTITGDEGFDSIDGGSGRDRASYAAATGAVAVTLAGDSWATVTIDGVDEDTIRSIEDIDGGSGADLLTGNGSANRLNGNAGNDSIDGADGSDLLLGDAGEDNLTGGTGNDTIDGGADNDTISGGTGNDSLLGGLGDDSITGGSNNDAIKGGDGNDQLFGESGNDKLYGDAGLDTLVGGAGRDSLSGGADADVFLYLDLADSGTGSTTRDYISDFVPNVDRIDLSAIDAMASVDLDQAFVLDAKGSSGTAVAEGHIGWYHVNKSGTANDRTYLRINTDGDSAMEMVIEIKGRVTLTDADFIL